MSVSPPPSPHRRPSTQRDSHEGPERLQIRLVPYSPPRISSDGSAPTSSRPTSYADNDNDNDHYNYGGSSPLPPSSPLGSDNVEVHYRDTPEPGVLRSPSHVSGLRRFSGYNATPGRQGQHRDFSVDPIEHRNDPIHAPVPQSPSPSPALSRSPSRTPSRTPSPFQRPRQIVTVHADKTFSLVPHAGSASSASASLRSPQPSFAASSSYGSSSFGRLSSGTFVDDQPSSPLTPLVERSLSPGLPAPSPTPLRDLADPAPTVDASPWNYRLAGGLRKVPTTPDSKQKQKRRASSVSADEPLPSLPEADSPEPAVAPPLATKPSFQSTNSSTSNSNSTLSDRTNYKVYGQSSPAGAAPASIASDTAGIDLDSLPSSSHSNYQLLGESSSSNQSLYDQPRPQTGESDANYIVHGASSAAVSTSSLITSKSRVRSEYSRESLIVPPLRPIKRRSAEQLGAIKTRSRDSLRTGSLTSISSFINQEATRALFAGQATVHFPPGAQKPHSRGGSSGSASNSMSMLPSHPHQWSSQLSTVASESEAGSEPPSRSLSPFTISNRRRSSGFNSSHSRQMLSISSSLGGLDEVASGSLSHSRSGSGSLEPPAPTLSRGATREPSTGNLRQIRHHDEDGDGLADLEQLHHRPSRTRLGSLLSSSSSERNLRSSGSSRANSLTQGSIPTWAKVYYGSGERRFLIAQASSDSMVSLYNESRPGSSFLNRSPSFERFGNIFAPRHRPRERAATQETPGQSSVQAQGRSRRRRSETGSMDITTHPVLRVARGMKKQTSSIWSPHLQHDRRASRYNIWEPPSAVWSDEGGFTSRRNLQVVLFIAGLVFPFAWMIAAFLPLPPIHQLDMVERLQSTSHLDLHLEASRQAHGIQEARYNSAKWWRNLNRVMSIIGLLLIGAAIALIVVGVRQKWA